MAKLCSKSSCNKQIQANHHGIKCERCDKVFHKKCSGLNDTLWKQFQSGDMLFNCPSCKLRRKSSVFVPNTPTSSPITLSGPKNAVVSDGSLIEVDNYSGIRPSKESSTAERLVSINITIKEMEKSLSDLSDSMTDVEVSIRRLETKMKEIDVVKEENIRLKNKINAIERRLNDLVENGTRKSLPNVNNQQVTKKSTHKITIGGIEVAQNEDVKELCSQVFSKLGVPVDVHTEVLECCRLKPNSTTSIPVIVVELLSKQCLDLVLKAVSQKELNNLDFGRETDSKVFVNEKLSSACYNLLKEAKKLRDCGYKFVWARNNRVLVRKVEGGRIMQMRDTTDVARLLN